MIFLHKNSSISNFLISNFYCRKLFLKAYGNLKIKKKTGYKKKNEFLQKRNCL